MLLRNERFLDYYSNQQDIHFGIFPIIAYDMVDVNNRKKVDGQDLFGWHYL